MEPKSKIPIVSELRIKRCLYSLYNPAKVRTGTAKKKEYSADSFLETPSALAVTIVAADLDTPGISAKH